MNEIQLKLLHDALVSINSVRIDLMPDSDDPDNEDEQSLSEIENLLIEFIDTYK